jgi:hypothetical protein
VIAWRPFVAGGLGVVALVLMVLLTGLLTDDVAGTWQAVFAPLGLIFAMCFCALFSVGVMSAMRIRARARRDLTRYEILLPQGDEAPAHEVWAMCDALVKTVRATLVARLFTGQPWVAFEFWHDPPRSAGETGEATMMLLCEPQTVGRVIATMRRIAPNIAVRHEHGAPKRFDELHFMPDHVLRVAKSLEFLLPITDPRAGRASARSATASITRTQQDLGAQGFASCVRVCILPAAGSMDHIAARRLRRMADRAEGANAAVSSAVLQAQKAAGGSLAFVELQAAIQDVRRPPQPAAIPATRRIARRRRGERRQSGEGRDWTFADRQGMCHALLAPAMSDASANNLTERLMYVRQGLYQRRWHRATPPLLPDQDGSTAMWPLELARLIEPPNLASEFDLPFTRSCVPNLPAPRGLPRATMLEPPHVPEDADDLTTRAFRTTRRVAADDLGELVSDAEIVNP